MVTIYLSEQGPPVIAALLWTPLGVAGAVPLVVAFAVMVAFLLAWIKARTWVNRHFTAPLRLTWSREETALDGDGEIGEELRGLGYAPVGTLTEREPSVCVMSVYVHSSLPIYGLVVRDLEANGTHGKPAVVLESYFCGGERITTSGMRGAREAGALVETAVPRLVQYRVDGTATALDGQHVGTLKAWMSSRSGGPRKPLPATREALIGYLEADHARVRKALEARGWVRPGTLLRLLIGQPRNSLGF